MLAHSLVRIPAFSGIFWRTPFPFRARRVNPTKCCERRSVVSPDGFRVRITGNVAKLSVPCRPDFRSSAARPDAVEGQCAGVDRVVWSSHHSSLSRPHELQGQNSFHAIVMSPEGFRGRDQYRRSSGFSISQTQADELTFKAFVFRSWIERKMSSAGALRMHLRGQSGKQEIRTDKNCTAVKMVAEARSEEVFFYLDPSQSLEG